MASQDELGCKKDFTTTIVYIIQTLFLNVVGLLLHVVVVLRFYSTGDPQSDILCVCIFHTNYSETCILCYPAALLPDYAIALIVIGVLMILAMVFCCIGVCFACSNNKSKDSESVTYDPVITSPFNYSYKSSLINFVPFE